MSSLVLSVRSLCKYPHSILFAMVISCKGLHQCHSEIYPCKQGMHLLLSTLGVNVSGKGFEFNSSLFTFNFMQGRVVTKP